MKKRFFSAVCVLAFLVNTPAFAIGIEDITTGKKEQIAVPVTETVGDSTDNADIINNIDDDDSGYAVISEESAESPAVKPGTKAKQFSPALTGESRSSSRNDLFNTLVRCAGVDSAAYTADSFELYEQAYSRAETVYWDAESDETEVRSAMQELLDAFAALKGAADIKILSGNIVSDFDKAYYRDFSMDTLKLSYTYMPGTNEDIVQNDPACNKMLQGTCDALSYIPYIAFGKWDSIAPSDMLFNLGEECYISGVDVWEFYRKDFSRIGWVRVYTSMNGTDFELVSETYNPTTDPELTDNNVIPQNFEPRKCRYLRVVAEKGDWHQIVMSEVVLRGFRITEEARAPYSFGILEYKNDRYERIISPDGANTVTVNGTVQSNTAEENDVLIVTAAYKDGDILDYDLKKAHIDAYEQTGFYNSLYLAGQSGISIYSFVLKEENGESVSLPRRFAQLRDDILRLDVSNPPMKSELSTVRFDPSGGTLTVSGRSSAENIRNSTVALRVLKPGISDSQLPEMDVTEFRESVIYLAQATVASDGGFTFTYAPGNVENGNYNIYVTDLDGNVLSDYVLFIGDEASLLAQINGAVTASAMEELLRSNSYLYSGVTVYEEITAKYPDMDVIASIAPMLAGGNYTSTDEFAKEVAKAVVAAAINAASSGAELIALLDQYQTDLGFSDSGIYTKLFLSMAAEESEKFLGRNYGTSAQFITEFCDTVLLDKLNGLSSYTDVMPVIECGRTYLTKMNFSDYDRLSNTEKVYVQKLVTEAGTLESIAQLIAVFNTAVKNAPDAVKTTPPKGGGGIGGSSAATKPVSGLTSQPVTDNPAPMRAGFDDLQQVSWAVESINALYERGIVNGVSANQFDPMGQVTREQYAKMVVQAYGLYRANAECEFSDVGTNEWYYRYIASAVASGIVSGISAEEFGTGSFITREDMAVMTFRAMQRTGLETTVEGSAFADDSTISDYAREAIYSLKGREIMNGKGDNLFAPKDFATRAEAAKIIYGAISAGGDQ